MSNKKLSRLLEPNLKFYFAVMLLFAVAAIPAIVLRSAFVVACVIFRR